MAAGDKVQIGKAYKVEFDGFVYAGRTPTQVTKAQTGDVLEHKGTRNETDTYIISDPGQVLTLNLEIEATATGHDDLKPGDIVTVTPPGGSATKYLIIDGGGAPVQYSNMITTQNVTLVRKDSMAATIDS